MALRLNKTKTRTKTKTNEYLCEVAESSLDGGGLFNIPLTPACKQAVEDMITTAKEIFKEWWESQ